MTRKEKAISAAKDIVLRLAKGKVAIQEEMAIIFALKEDNAEETLLLYLKDIKKLIENLINIIEEEK